MTFNETNLSVLLSGLQSTNAQETMSNLIDEMRSDSKAEEAATDVAISKRKIRCTMRPRRTNRAWLARSSAGSRWALWISWRSFLLWLPWVRILRSPQLSLLLPRLSVQRWWRRQ